MCENKCLRKNVPKDSGSNNVVVVGLVVELLHRGLYISWNWNVCDSILLSLLLGLSVADNYATFLDWRRSVRIGAIGRHFSLSSWSPGMFVWLIVRF